eukprot:3823739-Amphidinium_carterae.1
MSIGTLPHTMPRLLNSVSTLLLLPRHGKTSNLEIGWKTRPFFQAYGKPDQTLQRIAVAV